MTIDDAPASQPPGSHHIRQRLLVGGGIAVVIIAVAAHLAGGIALSHVRTGEALAIILVAIVAKMLLIHGARRAFPRR